MSRKERVEQAVKSLGFEDKEVFSVAELEQIMNAAKCEMIEVMWYLRYGR